MDLIGWLLKRQVERKHFQRSIFQSHPVMTVLINNPPTIREHREDSIFQDLLKMCHGLEERLLASSPEEIELIADLVMF